MPIDPAPYLDPATCAVINMECQENLIGPTSVLPGLARSAAECGLVENLSGLFNAARRVGTRIYYIRRNRSVATARLSHRLLHDRQTSCSTANKA